MEYGFLGTQGKPRYCELGKQIQRIRIRPTIAKACSLSQTFAMANSFTDLEDLANSLRLRLNGAGAVGIDGWTGVGKTTLANELAKELGGSSFDLDCALTRDQKVYVSAIRLNEVSDAFATQPRPLLVSGICLLEVLEKAELQLDATVYIKRMAAWGWADEDELKGIDFGLPEASGEAVREELRHYHQKWQPHLLADFEFHRTD